MPGLLELLQQLVQEQAALRVAVGAATAGGGSKGTKKKGKRRGLARWGELGCSNPGQVLFRRYVCLDLLLLLLTAAGMVTLRCFGLQEQRQTPAWQQHCLS
jgi:hypothetical protein